MKKLLSVILSLTIIFGLFGTAVTANADSGVLRFNKDGKFKIMVISDSQDNENPDSRMLQVIAGVLDMETPDLVVFTGDNVVVGTESKFRTGAEKLLKPLIDRNVPYAYTYGNHDDEYGVSKETQYNIYKSLGNCLTYDANPPMTGFGTCDIPIYSSDGSRMAFNLWMVDSNTYVKGTKQYDKVHDDQLEWLVKRNNEITAEQGRVINSLMFQHIIVPEITSCFKNSSWKNGFIEGKGSGTILEKPCPASIPSNQYRTVCEMGGVLGIVTGHDHINNFIAKPGPVDLIQMSGMTYHSYGKDSVRGCHIITLFENDTTIYEKKTYYSKIFLDGGYDNTEPSDVPPIYYSLTPGAAFVSEISFAASDSAADAKKALTSNGFTPVDFDLNKGAGGKYIFMGYKTTSDVNNSIRSIMFSNDEASPSQTRNYEGITYNLVNNCDLNAGSGGAYIFGYCSKDASAGTPVSEIIVNETARQPDATPCRNFTGKTQELNEGTKKHENSVYCHMKTNLPVLDVNGFFEIYETALSQDTSNMTPESAAALQAALDNAENAYNSLKTTRVTELTQTELNSLKTEITQAYESLHSHTPGAPATCTEGQYCTVCNELIKAPLGHLIVTHSEKPATCTEGGWNAYETCERCDYTTYNAIPAMTHSIVTHGAKTPTCTEKGWNAYETCARCDYTTYEELPATGHGIIYHDAKAATCTEKGHTAYVTCSRCGYTTFEETAPLGHTPAAAVEENRVEPSCVNNGRYDSVVYCDVCRTELSRESKTVDALGHDEISHDAKPATCTEKGNKAYVTCSRCDYTTYSELPMTPHTASEPITDKLPTCTETGRQHTECTVCHTVLSEASIPAVGHIDENGDEICDNCGRDLKLNCNHLCHKSGIAGFFWKIINFFYKLFRVNKYCKCGAAHW